MATEKAKTIQKTFKELKEIDNLIAGLYTTTPALKDTKFGYAYKRFAEKNYYPHNREYVEELTGIRIDNALIDEATKAILVNPDPMSRGFKYDKAGLKAVIKQEMALDRKWDAKVCDVEPYFIKKEHLPTLTDAQLEELKGTIVE